MKFEREDTKHMGTFYPREVMEWEIRHSSDSVEKLTQVVGIILERLSADAQRTVMDEISWGWKEVKE